MNYISHFFCRCAATLLRGMVPGHIAEAMVLKGMTSQEEGHQVLTVSWNN